MSQPPPPPDTGVKPPEPVSGGTEAVQDELFKLSEFCKDTVFSKQVQTTTDKATQQLDWLQSEIDRLKTEKDKWESMAIAHAHEALQLRMQLAQQQQ
jgi:hypothetical protein